MASEHKIGPQPGPERALLDFLSIFHFFYHIRCKKVQNGIKIDFFQILKGKTNQFWGGQADSGV